jgi:glycosyltransferase involved in cell wall biosynthesis
MEKQEQLPFVSIVVPTMASRVKFGHLLANNVSSQTYPHARLELLVVGDGDPLTREGFEDMTRLLDPGLRRRYIACDVLDNIGKKRNFCCSKASHKVIAMMDDDDVYSRGYIEHSVGELNRLKRDIVGCRDMIITWPSLDFETRFIRGSSIHEGTMVFRKRHWSRNRFKESRVGEGAQMVAGSFYNEIDIRRVMMCVAHGSNTFDKAPLLCGGASIELGDDKKEYMREILGLG